MTVLHVESGAVLGVRPAAVAARGIRWLWLTCLAVVVGLLPWRVGELYQGGVDVVVAAKGLLGVVALALAGSAYLRREATRPLGVRSVALLLGYVAISSFGGWAAGTAGASLVLSTRLLLLAATLGLLLAVFPVGQIVDAMAGAMAAVAAVAVATGLGSLVTEGRLAGGVPPLQANQLAFVLSVPLIAIGWRILHGRARPVHAVAAVPLLAALWLTESRTGLAALLVALALVAIQSRAIPLGGYVALVVGAASFALLALTTDLFVEYFGRGGTAKLLTLNSRTIAWQAAFTMPVDGWRQWWGGGLAVKSVPVSGTYWDSQVLDSSWVNTYVQAGVLGLVILTGWVLLTILAVVRVGQPLRSLLTALLGYVVVRSVTMGGLVDSALLFCCFFLVSVASEPVSRRHHPDPDP